VLARGLTFVSTAARSTDATQPPSTDTKPAFAAATGFIVNWFGMLEIGAIVGWDLGVSKADHAYAGKPWVMFSIDPALQSIDAAAAIASSVTVGVLLRTPRLTSGAFFPSYPARLAKFDRDHLGPSSESLSCGDVDVLSRSP